jgi:hypothetical protein
MVQRKKVPAKPMPKPKVIPTPKPPIKYDKNGIRILPGTGSVTKNETFPELRKPGGIKGPALKPRPTSKATAKVKIPSMIGKATVKSKYTQLPRKTK